MSFLKKHYEKIILTIMLVVFVVALVWLLITFWQITQVRAEDIKLPVIKPTYNRVDFKKPEYDVVNNMRVADKWEIPIIKEDKGQADFLLPLQIAECPYCHNLIPASDFPVGINVKPGKCSYCGAVLKSIPPRPKDADGGGVPDKLEKLYGMDPDDPDDDREDLDGDKFNSAEEIVFADERNYKTDINDPKLHPPLALNLSLVRLDREKLNLLVKRVNKSGGDKPVYEVHINTKRKSGASKTYFKKMHGTILIDEVQYRIIDIDPIFVDVEDPTTSSIVKVDKSQIIIERLTDKVRIRCTVNEPVYDPKEKVYLYDKTWRKKYRNLYAGSSFTMGNSKIGNEKYTLLKVNAKERKSEEEYVIVEGMGFTFKINESGASIDKDKRPKADAKKGGKDQPEVKKSDLKKDDEKNK